ncbi:MAG: hypothetical protein ACOC1F_08235, partial [Myxococcota bacterium]
VYFTLGRVLLRAGALEQARHAFDRARRCGVSPHRVAAYAAEIAFRSRDFARSCAPAGGTADQPVVPNESLPAEMTHG